MLLAAIVALLLWGGPSDVSGAVVPIHVDAVNGVLRSRTSTDVGEERGERSAPASADADSTAAVSGEVCNVRIGAARDHVAPDTVLQRSAIADSMAVSPICVTESDRPLQVEAAAAPGAAADQTLPCRNPFGPAAADATPHGVLVVHADEGHDSKTTELTAYEVEDLLHRWILP